MVTKDNPIIFNHLFIFRFLSSGISVVNKDVTATSQWRAFGCPTGRKDVLFQGIDSSFKTSLVNLLSYVTFKTCFHIYICFLFQLKNRHKFNVLLLTFLSYASYHMARKPTSVVKNVLHHDNCTEFTPPSDLNLTGIEETWCSWKPFGSAKQNYCFMSTNLMVSGNIWI